MTLTRIFHVQCCLEPHRQHCKGFYMYSIVPRVWRQHWTWFFPVQCFLEPLVQHCTRFLPVYCWLTDNFYKENNLCNVILTILGQHCIGILSSQCCLNMFKTTLHTKNIYAMLVKGTQTCVCCNLFVLLFLVTPCLIVAVQALHGVNPN